MIPEEQTLVESVETYLTQLHERMRSISSDETLFRVTRLLDGTAANIREMSNARRPLLSIPTELLQIIMAFIPDAVKSDMLRPVWDAEMYHTAMIIPTTQACRRLRQRSQGVPLELFLPLGPIVEHVSADVAKEFSSRVRVLHVRGSAGFMTRGFLEAILMGGLLPHLESLSVQLYEHPNPDPIWAELENEQWAYFHCLPDYTLPENIPRLRRISLDSCYVDCPGILSSITHLAIKNVGHSSSHAHSSIRRTLALCSSLQSLHLEEIRIHPADPPEPDPPFDFYQQTPEMLHACRRLRRVALLKMNGPLASFILSQVLADQNGLALQLHDLQTPLDPTLPHDLLTGTSRPT